MKKKLSASAINQDEKLTDVEQDDRLDPEMSLQSVKFAPKENSLLNEYEDNDTVD